MPDTAGAASTLGLALSGGGSRAAAFHIGTVQGLSEIGLLEAVDVVSTVSGGSVFGAAWFAARWKGHDLNTFMRDMATELARGFVARSLNIRLLKLFLPSYTRSSLLSETFNDALTHGMRLADLPERPLLCINTSVMNTGQVGKFSRYGFSSTGIYAPGSAQTATNPSIPMPDLPVALAAAASAAFPVGLPPVYLKRGVQIPEGWGGPDLAKHRRLALTDGGVIENLGVQTLLKSLRFAAWNLVISDAGRKEQLWEPGGLGNYISGVLMGIISFPIIQRVTMMMNNKENRHMRMSAFGELEHSWLIDALRGNSSPGLNEYLGGQRVSPRRRVLYVRLNQTWSELLANIPRWRLIELAARSGRTLPDPLPATAELILHLGIDLTVAQGIHGRMGGDARISELNRIDTHFTALSEKDIEGLIAHARWQVHAVHALFNDPAAKAAEQVKQP